MNQESHVETVLKQHYLQPVKWKKTELGLSILMHIDGSGNGYSDVDEYGSE